MPAKIWGVSASGGQNRPLVPGEGPDRLTSHSGAPLGAWRQARADLWVQLHRVRSVWGRVAPVPPPLRGVCGRAHPTCTRMADAIVWGVEGGGMEVQPEPTAMEGKVRGRAIAGVKASRGPP
jgi:hypothetical protein